MKVYARTRGRTVSSTAMRRILEREYPENTIAELAERIGYAGEDGLRFRLFKYRLMNFDVADRILTRLDLHHLWHMDVSLRAACRFLDELPEPNEAKRLYEIERGKRRRAARPKKTSVCEGCGKRHKRKRTATSQMFAKYCSQSCQQLAWQRRNGERIQARRRAARRAVAA